MLRSEGRILTTHAGSLPRRESLIAMLVKSSRGEDVDRAAMLREIEISTRYVVQKQLEAGIDVGNNGEQSRESFFTYVQHRMTGFGGRSERPIMRDLVRYQSFSKLIAPMLQRSMVDLLHAPKAIGKVEYRDCAARRSRMRRYPAHPGRSAGKFAEPFMTAPSPGIIASAMLNEYYENYEEYVIAVAKALHTEYEYIVSNGIRSAGRLPGSRDGAAHVVRRPSARRFPQVRRTEHRRDESRSAWNRARSGPHARMLG